MIFIVTGTQEPFDRMVRAVDEVAATFKSVNFIAQISKSTICTPNLQTFDFIPPIEFEYYFNKASVIISHAGMGTILSALERNKPIVVIPRLFKYGEHRNDHQVATCKVFEKLGYVNVAYDEEELKEKIAKIISSEAYPMYKIGKYASDNLIKSIRNFMID